MGCPLFADGDPVGPVGWGALVLAVGSTIVNVIQAIINTRHKNKLEADAASTKARQEMEQSAVEQYRQLVALLREQLAGYDRKVEDFTRALAQARVREQTCQEQLNDSWAAILMIYDQLERVHAAAEKGGIKVEPLQARPTRRYVPREAEFVQANNEHEVGLLRKEREDHTGGTGGS